MMQYLKDSAIFATSKYKLIIPFGLKWLIITSILVSLSLAQNISG